MPARDGLLSQLKLRPCDEQSGSIHGLCLTAVPPKAGILARTETKTQNIVTDRRLTTLLSQILAVALMRERRGLIASFVAQRNQRSHFRCPACGYPASEQRN